jgi:hypothetical protein
MSKLPNLNSSDTEERPPSTPRWVKISGIIAIVLILLVVIIMFISGGNHGPGRHGLGYNGTVGTLAYQIEQEEPREDPPPYLTSNLLEVVTDDYVTSSP